MKDETRQWIARAEEHLDVAFALFESVHYPQSVFFCQQALELLLKAMWIEQADSGLPRRTHDLVSLVEELGLALSEEQLGFLRGLTEQYIPTRYADMPVEYSLEDAVEYLEQAKELFA